MDPLVLAIIEALLSTAGALGITLGRERASTRANQDATRAIERATSGSRQKLLATTWGTLPTTSIDAMLRFVDSSMGRQSMRTLVVATLTTASDVSASPIVEAMRSQAAPEDDQLLTMLELSMIVSQCVPQRQARSCAAALLSATQAIAGDVAKLMRRLHREDYRAIRQSLLADRQAELIMNVARFNGTLQSLVNVDVAASQLFARRVRALIHDTYASVAAPYFQKRPPIPYDEIYVAPILDAGDGADEEDESENVAGWTVDELLDKAYRDVILGNPGAGKSTVLRFIAHAISRPGYRNDELVPFFVSIREYDAARKSHNLTLCEFVAQSMRRDFQVEPPPSGVEYLCAAGGAVLLLDGLDEVLEPSGRRDVVTAISNFSALYPATPILVTSRSVGYDQAPLYAKVFKQSKLSPFTDTQVSEYAQKWFAGEPDLDAEDRLVVGSAFLRDLSSVGEDLRSNPLTLSLLCNVYRRIRSIPQSRADLYEECANMLFERWDRSRGILGAGPLRGEARDALQDVALWMYTRAPDSDSSRTDGASADVASVEQAIISVTRTELRRRLIKYWNSRLDSAARAEQMASDLIESWEGRAWILTDVGSNLQESRYGFTHQTFLEYFSANEFVRRHPTPGKLAAALIPKLAVGAWDVVGEIAAQIINRNVRGGCDKLVKKLMRRATQLSPIKRSAVVAFATRHIDSLPLSASTQRAIIAESVRLFLLSQPVFDRVPSWRDYDEQLWFRTDLDEFLDAIEEPAEDGVETTDLLVDYFAVARASETQEEDARHSFALPFLALMRSRVPETVSLIQVESTHELLRTARSWSGGPQLASSALVTMLKPAQLDYAFHEVYSAFSRSWQFDGVQFDGVTSTELAELCGHLRTSNFLVSTLGASSGYLEPSSILPTPAGWQALFVSVPEWLDGVVSENARGGGVPPALRSLTSTLDRYCSTGDVDSVADEIARSIQLGSWCISRLLEGDYWHTQGSRIDRDWLSQWGLSAWLSRVASSSTRESDPIQEWDALTSLGVTTGKDPLLTALGNEGMVGIFFSAMVWHEANGARSIDVVEERLGSLAGLADLLNCRSDGVPYLRSPWADARGWEHYELVTKWLSKWATAQVSFTYSTWEG